MHLDFLASEELGGRYTLSPSLPIAARYLASHLQSYGFRGAGDHGGFLQHFDVIASKPDAANTSLAITFGGKTQTYELGDFSFTVGAGSADIRAPIVFAGAGISSPEQNHDDYAGLNVKGKVVLVAPGNAGMDVSGLDDDEQGEGAARAHGALAVMKIPSQRLAGIMHSSGYRDRVLHREDVRLAQEAEALLPTVTLGQDIADKLLASAGMSLSAIYAAVDQKRTVEPRTLDASAHLVLRVHQNRATTQNVAGILDGTDPQLRNEYVVFSAHYDHLETSGGQIYPGADDDGSGTTAVLAIAHALALNRPRRSVLIIFHAGEELGLLGSEYNTEYAPAVPMNKLVVDLNIDMIGRAKLPGDSDIADEHLSPANTVYLVGAGRISAELRRISEDTNAQFERMKLDYYYDEPSNPERIYYRSDHWNYAKHGVPVIFYFDGIHADYHKPTDTVDKIDFNKLTQITRLVFETGWRIANLDHRLTKTQ